MDLDVGQTLIRLAGCMDHIHSNVVGKCMNSSCAKSHWMGEFLLMFLWGIGDVRSSELC
jgi:hypothetical protein